MSIHKFLEDMTMIQANLIDYLDDDENIEERYQVLENIFNDIKIHDDKHKLSSLFYLITKISNNHHRNNNFFSKIESILSIFKRNMKKNFKNSELFHIFKSNKRILLYLVEEKIMIIDDYIIRKMKSVKYSSCYYQEYFLPEIEKLSEDNLPRNFYERRKTGENDSIICQLIQKDSLEDFIQHISKYKQSLYSQIGLSEYETNSFLIKRRDNLTLMKYAAFCGSINIFKYLQSNGIKLAPSLWIYAIHGNNREIIQILEDNNIEPEDKSFKECLKESIKCHNNEFANYFLSNFNDEDNFLLINALKYYNFNFLQNELSIKSLFYYLCKYDYFVIVYILAKKMNIDINMKTIFK